MESFSKSVCILRTLLFDSAESGIMMAASTGFIVDSVDCVDIWNNVTSERSHDSEDEAELLSFVV
jgi:hypothetical protein